MDHDFVDSDQHIGKEQQTKGGAAALKSTILDTRYKHRMLSTNSVVLGSVERGAAVGRGPLRAGDLMAQSYSVFASFKISCVLD